MVANNLTRLGVFHQLLLHSNGYTEWMMKWKNIERAFQLEKCAKCEAIDPCSVRKNRKRSGQLSPVILFDSSRYYVFKTHSCSTRLDKSDFFSQTVPVMVSLVILGGAIFNPTFKDHNWWLRCTQFNNHRGINSL